MTYNELLTKIDITKPIIIEGCTGSGKTSLAKKLSKDLHMNYIEDKKLHDNPLLYKHIEDINKNGVLFVADRISVIHNAIYEDFENINIVKSINNIRHNIWPWLKHIEHKYNIIYIKCSTVTLEQRCKDTKLKKYIPFINSQYNYVFKHSGITYTGIEGE